MTESTQYERAVTTPGVFNERIVRVEPNVRPFPHDADIIVTTEPEDQHTLTFRVAANGTREHIFLTAAEPPLEGRDITDDHTFWVNKDLIAKGKEFDLSAAFPELSKTRFRAVSMMAEVAVVRSDASRQ
jgi:hypothetical protein